MATAVPVVMGWGSLALSTDRLNTLNVDLDNSQGAMSAFPAGMRMTYLEQTYVLTCAPAAIFSVFPGVTTSGAYATQLALRAGTPVTILKLTLTPLAGGAAVVFYLTDFPGGVANVDTLYQAPIFAGMIDTWGYTLNKFTLSLTGTDHQEDKLVPRNLVTLYDWPNCGNDIGQAFPEVYGNPGPVPDNSGGDYSLSPGFGAVPAVLVDRAALKYIVAGHAVKLIGGATSGPISVWVKLPGYDNGYAVIKNCQLSLSTPFHPVYGGGDTDGVIAYITLPQIVWADLYLPTLGVGDYVANTAGNPTGACGNAGYLPFPLSNGQPATIAAGQILELLMASGFSNQGITILRVFIAGGVTGGSLQANWIGPQSNIVATGAGFIGIDSSAGWDASGKVQVGSGTYSYTSIVTAGSSQYNLQIAGYSGSDTGKATECGTPQAFTGEVEVTTQRNWGQGDFYKFELQLTNSGSPASIAWLGFHVMVEVTGYPDVYVPVSGVDISLHSTDYGASSNPAVQMADVYKRLEGLTDAEIGTTFDTVLAALASKKWDWSLVDQEQTSQLLSDMLQQSNMFTWRDGNNAVQVALYQLDAQATVTLQALVDIIDEKGDNFQVTWTQPENIYNRVVVNWGYNYARKAYQQTFRINELGCVPSDSARQAAALASQTQIDMINTLSVDASLIQDSTTALALLQFLFDFWSVRRRTITFDVPMHTQVTPGTFCNISHPLLSTNDVYLVQTVARNGDVLTITALSIAYGAVATDQVAFQVQSSDSVDSLWGSPGFFAPWGGSNISSGGAVTGLVVDHGLITFAARIAGSGTEKPMYAGIGSSATAATPGDVQLGAQLGARKPISSGFPTRAAGTVTWKFAFTAIGGALTINEIGLFGDASGTTLLGHVVLGSSISVPQDDSVTVTITVRVSRPSAGSGLTDFGCGIFADMLFESTDPPAADYGVGTSGTAESGSDVALGAQIGARVLITAGTPNANGKIVQVKAYFTGTLYGGNTVKELGIFQDASGNTADVRNVPASPIVVPAGSSLSVVHNLDMINYV